MTISFAVLATKGGDTLRDAFPSHRTVTVYRLAFGNRFNRGTQKRLNSKGEVGRLSGASARVPSPESLISPEKLGVAVSTRLLFPPPCLSFGGPGSIIGDSTAGGKTRSQEEWVWWACRMSGALHVLSSGEAKGKSVVFLRRLSKVFGGAKSEMISRGR
ncbi:hypothetical protein Bca4012_070965 [Brassica carinata]|uniref:Uncharacterized protein n=1 Tax=Brassica carinata TaxID=52824 RepID=A0A8X7QEF4_BRACI|nr:hypothetical protein Bca52824_063257 [Brassica carinata]